MICAIRTATRRLSFQIPSFYTRHPSTSKKCFFPESPERPTIGHYWGPGESLPAHCKNIKFILNHGKVISVAYPLDVYCDFPMVCITDYYTLQKIEVILTTLWLSQLQINRKPFP